MKNKELFIINWIRKQATRRLRTPGVGLGIGDDAAILASPAHDRELLITTDLIVEGTHFERDSHPPHALGHKALARGLSDIAAMGGKPLYALLSVSLPHGTDRKWLKQFYQGLFQLADGTGVSVIGGDLAAGPALTADIVVLGAAPAGRSLRRSGAEPGDTLYVSGSLGGSALGLESLRAGQSTQNAAVRRHLYPRPHLELGRRLVRLGATSAMDVSDGLSLDLYRLTQESQVGAEVRVKDIPVFPGASLGQALHGGEDYELLFTMPSRRKPPAGVSAIGTITKARRLTVVGPGRARRRLPIQGFEHNLCTRSFTRTQEGALDAAARTWRWPT